MWNSPTQELASVLTSTVFQYTFAQPNPFSGPFHDVPNHALDLAYLHGNPEIFEGLEKDGELADAIKGYWINFAHRERVWNKGEMWEFGPNGGTELGGFLKGRKEKWAAFEGLTFGEKEGVAGAVMGHLAQMNGLE